MVIINNIEYDSFRKNLDMIITDTPSLTKDLLKKLMRNKSFRQKRQIDFDKELGREVKYNINVEPTETQLNIAWEYAQSKSIKKRDMTFTRYRTEKYKNHTIKRALGEVKFKNKIYKRGQFLPKKYEE